MKFTIGQRVRFYVSEEFLTGQGILSKCSPGWVSGEVTKLYPQDRVRPLHVSLDPETNVLSVYVNSLRFTEKGHYYIDTARRDDAEQLTLQPLIILKRRHL